MKPAALCLANLIFWAAAGTGPAAAACSRTVSVAYSSPIAATVYGALPAQSLPSLIDAIAGASGCKLSTENLPTTRAWRNFSEGQLDVILVAIQTEERDRIGDFDLGGVSPWALVTRRAEQDSPRRLNDFGGNRQLRLGVARGAAWPAEADQLMDRLRANGQIDESSDFGMALTKLANGRDAAVLMITDAYLALMAASGDTRFAAVAQPGLRPSKIGTYLNHGTLTAEDRKALLKGLHQVRDSGLSDKLLKARVPELAVQESRAH